MNKKPLREVIKAQQDWLMQIDGIEGVGESLWDGQAALIVFVSKITSEIKKNIPPQIDDYPVIIQFSGQIQALPLK